MQASIQLIIGPMFSGKSTELLRRADRYRIQNKKVVFFKYEKDTRYSADSIATHTGTKIKALPLVSLKQLESEYKEVIESADVICIDEIQFIEGADLCEQLSNELNKTFIFAGLNGDFQKKPF